MSLAEAANMQCTLCSTLSNSESAHSKYGWEQDDTSLPAAAHRLTVIRDFRPHRDRKLQLRQCPECNTCYLYETDYEFLVNGSENEEHLTRLTEGEAADYLQRPTQE